MLQEIAAWLRAPENADEFLVVFFDDEKDVDTWVRLPRSPLHLSTQLRSPAELASASWRAWGSRTVPAGASLMTCRRSHSPWTRRPRAWRRPRNEGPLPSTYRCSHLQPSTLLLRPLPVSR